MNPLSSTPPGTSSFVPPRPVRAFTIVEVMAAAMVMALVLTTSITTMQQGFNAIDTARCTTLAAQILQSTAENLRLENWSQISAYTASQTVDISTIYGTGLPVAKNYACTLAVTDVSGQANMKKLVLTVTWNGLDGRPHSLNTTSYYSKNGLYDYFYTSH